jgi:hypothetical protein
MSKLGTNIFLIATTYSPRQFKKIGVVKDDYLEFPILKYQFELDVRVILPATFWFGIFSFISDFFRFFPLNLDYFWTKSRKRNLWVFFHPICGATTLDTLILVADGRKLSIPWLEMCRA